MYEHICTVVMVRANHCPAVDNPGVALAVAVEVLGGLTLGRGLGVKPVGGRSTIYHQRGYYTVRVIHLPHRN
jgi:hypothetical protein